MVVYSRRRMMSPPSCKRLRDTDLNLESSFRKHMKLAEESAKENDVNILKRRLNQQGEQRKDYRYFSKRLCINDKKEFQSLNKNNDGIFNKSMENKQNSLKRMRTDIDYEAYHRSKRIHIQEKETNMCENNNMVMDVNDIKPEFALVPYVGSTMVPFNYEKDNKSLPINRNQELRIVPYENHNNNKFNQQIVYPKRQLALCDWDPKKHGPIRPMWQPKTEENILERQGHTFLDQKISIDPYVQSSLPKPSRCEILLLDDDNSDDVTMDD